MSPVNAGFTLIEILVVIFIVAISASVVLLSTNQINDNGLEKEADRLSSLLSLARQESVLQSKEMALELNHRGYQFLIYEEQQWTSVDDEIFRSRELEEGFQIDVMIEGEEIDFTEDEEEQDPRIYILSSGEFTPFEIEIQREDDETSYQIKGEINGKISRETIEY